MPEDSSKLMRRIMRLDKKWTSQLLVTLHFKERINFNGFKRQIRGITSKVLSDRLRRLEKYHFIKRVEAPEKMIRWHYKLTKRGAAFVISLLDAVNYGIQKEREKKN